MNLWKRLYRQSEDRYLAVRKKSFIAYLLFQLIFCFFTLYMAIRYSANRDVYIYATVLTMVFPLTALLFSLKFYKATVRIFAIYNWTAAAVFLLAINGSNTNNALMTFIFLTVSVYSTLLIGYRWGIAFTLLTLLVYVIDFRVEALFPQFGRQLEPISRFDFTFINFCYFFTNVGFICVYSWLLKESMKEYKEESELRQNAQRELEDVNFVLKDMNAELEEHTASLEEVNKKLALYAHKNAHEVRAPLCRLLGLTYLIDKAETNDEHSFIVNQIKNSASEMNKVIHNMNELLQEDEFIRLDFDGDGRNK